MTFASRLLVQEDMAVLFYARVSGLTLNGKGLVFSNMPIPTVWDTGGGVVSIGGEDYTWSTSLLVDKLGAVSASVAPKRGMGVTGSLKVPFKLTGTQADQSGDVWFDLTNHSLHRTDRNYSTLTADLDIGATASAQVSTTVGWPSGSGTRILCIGTETVGYATTTAGTGIGDATFVTLTRGLFGSFDTFHVGGVESARETGASGTHISSGPLVIEGRVIEIWMAGGKIEDGVFTPHSSTPQTTEDFEFYKGTITRSKPNRAINAIELDTQTLDQELAKLAGSRMPRAKAFRAAGGRISNTIQIDPSCNQIPWKFVTYGGGGGTAVGHTPTNGTRLQMDDGASGSVVVPDGEYSAGQIGEYINHTINVAATYDFPITGYDVTFSLKIDGENRYYISVDVIASPTPYGEWILQVTRADTLWAQLGFPIGEHRTVTIDGASNTQEAVATKKRASFFWPANTKPRRLYYEDHTGPDFTESPGWTDDDGTAVDGFVRIGDREIVGFVAKGSFLGADTGYLGCTIRHSFGSLLEEDWYIEANPEDDKNPVILQIPAFPKTSAAKVMLYLLLSVSGGGDNHATYDKGWRGAGIGVDVSLVDVDTFEAYDNERLDQKGRYLAIREPIPLRDFIRHELLIGQAFLGADSDETSGHKIRLIPVEPPSEDAVELSSTRVINHNSLMSEKSAAMSFDAGIQRVINAITIEAGYDTAKGKFFDTFDQLHATSKGTFGEQEALEIELRGLANTIRSDRQSIVIQRVTKQIWVAYAWPYVVVQFAIGIYHSWVWRIGDACVISHDTLPALNTVGRGWTSVLGRIYKISKEFRSSERRSAVTAVIRRWQGKRFGTFSPSAYLESKSSDTVWTATANLYSDSTEGTDASHFDAGDKVRVYTPGTDTFVIATILSAGGTTVTFTGVGVVLSAPLIMTSIGYDDSGIADSQKRHVFIASWDPPAQLTDSGANNDPAYYIT
jgi:hypothetical protein